MCVTKVSGWDAKDFADPRSAAYLASNVSTFCDAAIRKIVKAGGTYGDNSVLIKMIVKENTNEG